MVQNRVPTKKGPPLYFNSRISKFQSAHRMDWGSFTLSHYGSSAERSMAEIIGHYFMLMKWEFQGWIGSGPRLKFFSFSIKYFY